MHRRPPVPVMIIVILAVLVGAYFIYAQINQPVDSSILTASGTVETTSIVISPELAGKVVDVVVAEGDSVRRGDILLRLDDTLLKAQRELALAGLDAAKAAAVTADAAIASAQAQVDIALITALNEDKTNRIASWNQTKPSDFTNPNWYFNKSEELDAVKQEQDSAQLALRLAQDNLVFVQEKATSGEFAAAEKRLLSARIAYQLSQEVLTRANAAVDGADLKTEAQKIFDDAKSELIDAQKAYDDSITTNGAKDVLVARARLLVAQERADVAVDRLRSAQTGLLSPRVVAAQKALDQVSAAAAQARLAVKQAESNLKLIDVQQTKLVIAAPADGVILSRNVEPGEVVSPGSIVLTLGRLADLTLTVYIPEDRYAEISLGQAVDVSVDSFPGETFSASVIQISDKAEFTPRNVQTSDGRKSTVFAIKLRVQDTNARLKPGMPADVVFK